MITGPMPIELIMLGCAISLILVQILLQAGTSVLVVGFPHALGPRDEEVDIRSKLAGRSERALRNVLETFPLFAALAIALAITGRTGGNAALGAQIYVWARLIYVPVYLAGIPVVRTLVWATSMAGVALMLIALLR